MHYSWRHRIHGIAAGAAAVILAASLAAGSSVRVRADQGEYQRVESTAGSSAGSGAGSGSTRTRGLTKRVNARSGDTAAVASSGTSGYASSGAGSGNCVGEASGSDTAGAGVAGARGGTSGARTAAAAVAGTDAGAVGSGAAAAGAGAGADAVGGTGTGDASRPGQTNSSDSGLANTNNAYLYDNSLVNTAGVILVMAAGAAVPWRRR